MASNPLFLTTAIEAVVRAGDLQMARFGHDIQIDKKGAIDLVTEVDVEVERMFRDLIAERFPDHQILAEEFGGAKTVPEGPCWVFDPIDGKVRCFRNRDGQLAEVPVQGDTLSSQAIDGLVLKLSQIRPSRI